MSKVVLVMESPFDCGGCPFATLSHDGDRFYCGVDFLDMRTLTNADSKPDWCPLMPEPERADSNDKTYDGLNFADGWNACIDALEGKHD